MRQNLKSLRAREQNMFEWRQEPCQFRDITDKGCFPLSQIFRKFRSEVKWKGPDRFGLVRPEYLGPPLEVVHFDRSDRLDRSLPFHLPNLLFPVALFLLLLDTSMMATVQTYMCRYCNYTTTDLTELLYCSLKIAKYAI